MYCVKQLQEDLYWVGGNDRRLALFESAYPIPQGVSYNAYLLLDEKTVLLDTVDHSVGEQLWENLEHLLEGRSLDYLVVNHMEPDHCAMLQEAVRRWPGLQVVGNAKTMTMIRQFFDLDPATHTMTVKEGDTLATGRHTLTFVMAPMVHWPEAMVTYDVTTKTLFSADAFGSFGAINGNLYADEVEFAQEWLTEALLYEYRWQIWQPGTGAAEKSGWSGDQPTLSAAWSCLAEGYRLVCGKVSALEQLSAGGSPGDGRLCFDLRSPAECGRDSGHAFGRARPAAYRHV